MLSNLSISPNTLIKALGESIAQKYIWYINLSPISKLSHFKISERKPLFTNTYVETGTYANYDKILKR